MFETIGRSFRLLKLCLHVLAVDKELILFPVFSTIGVILVSLTFLGVGFGIGAFERLESEEGPGVIDLAVLFCFYVAAYFVIIFFNSALVFAAHERLAGGDPNIRSGLNGAFFRVITIFKWAIIAATVGLILRILAGQARERGGIIGIIGYIVVQMLGAAWTMVTFFVVPLIVIERRSLSDSFKTSLSMLRRTWGRADNGQLRAGNSRAGSGTRGRGNRRGVVLRAVAAWSCGHRAGDWHRRCAAGGRGAGVCHAGRHLQGGAVQLRLGRPGALAIPGRRGSGRVPAEVKRMSAACSARFAQPNHPATDGARRNAMR